MGDGPTFRGADGARRCAAQFSDASIRLSTCCLSVARSTVRCNGATAAALKISNDDRRTRDQLIESFGKEELRTIGIASKLRHRCRSVSVTQSKKLKFPRSFYPCSSPRFSSYPPYRYTHLFTQISTYSRRERERGKERTTRREEKTAAADKLREPRLFLATDSPTLFFFPV